MGFRNQQVVACLLFALLITSSQHASGDLILVQVTGEVTTVFGDPFALGLVTGDVLTGQVFYDTTTTADPAGLPFNLSIYTQSLPNGLIFTVGTGVFSANSYNVFIANDRNGNDIFGFQVSQSGSAIVPAGPMLLNGTPVTGPNGGMGADFSDTTASVFSVPDLPSVLPPSTAFDNHGQFRFFDITSPSFVGFDVGNVSFTGAVVPEPSAFLFFGVVGLGLGARKMLMLRWT